jgi:hypothetical protein
MTNQKDLTVVSPHNPLPFRTVNGDPQHAPSVAHDRARIITRIIGCTCGWQTPSGTTDSDEAFTMHCAVVSVHPGMDVYLELRNERGIPAKPHAALLVQEETT